MRTVGFFGVATSVNTDVEDQVFKGSDLVARILTSEEEYRRAIPELDALAFGNDGCVNAEDAAALAPRCRIIARQAIGYDNIDLEAAKRHGIIVTNVPDYCVEEVADHSVTLALTLARMVPLYHHMIVSERVWDQSRIPPMKKLSQMVLGLVGFGRIPRLMVPRARPFFGRILAYDPFIDPQAASELGVEVAGSLAELAPQVDVLSLHAPGLAANHKMISREILRSMKPEAYLVNVARGSLVDEEALYQALKEGWIKAAAVDILTEEFPSFDNPLFTLNNIIFTPHIGWRSSQALVELRRRTAEEILRVMNGQAPLHQVNK